MAQAGPRAEGGVGVPPEQMQIDQIFGGLLLGQERTIFHCPNWLGLRLEKCSSREEAGKGFRCHPASFTPSGCAPTSWLLEKPLWLW